MEQTRLLFEAGVAWQAARVATDEDIRPPEGGARCQCRGASAIRAVFIRTDVAFHSELTVITRNPVFIGVHDALVGWLIDQRTTTIHMPDADRLSIRDHTAIYEAVAARDPMRAFHEMTEPSAADQRALPRIEAALGRDPAPGRPRRRRPHRARAGIHVERLAERRRRCRRTKAGRSRPSTTRAGRAKRASKAHDGRTLSGRGEP